MTTQQPEGTHRAEGEDQDEKLDTSGDATIRFRWPHADSDTVLDLDLESLNVAETRLVKRRFQGTTYRKMLRGIADLDGDAISAIIYVATLRTGTPAKLEDLDKVKPIEFVTKHLVEDEDTKPPTREEQQDAMAVMADLEDGADPT